MSKVKPESKTEDSEKAGKPGLVILNRGNHVEALAYSTLGVGLCNMSRGFIVPTPKQKAVTGDVFAIYAYVLRRGKLTPEVLPVTLEPAKGLLKGFPTITRGKIELARDFLLPEQYEDIVTVLKRLRAGFLDEALAEYALDYKATPDEATQATICKQLHKMLRA